MVWFAVTLLLLTSSGVLAMGNTVLDVYRTTNRTRAKLFEYEERFAKKVRLVNPPPVVNLPSMTKVVAPEDVKAWPPDLDRTEVLRRAAISGLLPDEDLKALVDAHETANITVRTRLGLDEILRDLEQEIADTESKIRSRELSNNNYENRISRLVQQAATLRVDLHARLVRARHLIGEGFHMARRAYGDNKAVVTSAGN